MDKYLNYPTKKYGRIKPRDYQQAAIDLAIEHCKTSLSPAVLDMSVGAGKTIVIGALAKHVSDNNGAVLVLSRQSIIQEQNSQDAWLCECANSLYSAGLGVKSSAYNTIFGTEGTVYNSLMQDIKYRNGESKNPSKLFNYRPNLLLIDECHHYDWLNDECQYSKIINELYARNPKLRIIGLTGTSYRSTSPIIGEGENYFWKKKIIDINTEYLTNRGYLVPVKFGFGSGEAKYDLDEFKSSGEEGMKDFTQEELKAMEEKILAAETTTEKIIIEVVEKTKNRNGVMICVTGKKHMQEAAKFLPKGSYAMITDDTPERERNKLLREVYNGDKKFVLQINALSTGYNSPRLDTLVILRKYGSLTLLVQTIGRVLRLLKDDQIADGLVKKDALVLDYSDTMSEMRDLYDNPILEAADYSKAEENNDTVQCPKCQTENSPYAVRCRGISSTGRCDFFFKSRVCEPFYINGILKNKGCGAENAPTARNCRICENTLIDPNENLSRKHYTAHDFKPVMEFSIKPTKNNGVVIKYHLVGGEVAQLFFNPFSENQTAKRMWYNNFVKHVADKATQTLIRKCRNAGEISSLQSKLDTVSAITHRKNDKGKSIVSKFILKNT